MSAIGGSDSIRKAEEYLISEKPGDSVRYFSVSKGRGSKEAFVGLTSQKEGEEALLNVCNNLARNTLDQHTMTILKDKKGYLDSAKVTNFANKAKVLIKDLRAEYAKSKSDSMKLEELTDFERDVRKIERLAVLHSRD